MSNIYERLGLKPLINARGTHTRLGGSIMEPEVVEAMHEAARAYIVLDELQDKASDLIARATGAQAGMVTGGAAAGLLVGTAACVAGSDPIKIDQLPDTTGLKGEAIVYRAHRNGYDHSVRAAGVKLIEVGYGHSTISLSTRSRIQRTHCAGLLRRITLDQPGRAAAVADLRDRSPPRCAGLGGRCGYAAAE